MGVPAVAFGQPSFYIGQQTWNDEPYSIKDAALDAHWLVSGSPKSGKSVLQTNLSLQVIASGEGGLFVDLQGNQGGFTDPLPGLCGRFRLHHRKKIKILDFSSDRYAPNLGLLHVPVGGTPIASANGAVGAIGRAWGENIWELPRAWRGLKHLFVALIEAELTLTESGILLWDELGERVRDELIGRIRTQATRRFWELVVKLPAARRDERLESTCSRVEPFLDNPYLRRAFGQSPARTLDLAKEMDEGNALIVRMPWDNIRLSQKDSRLIGAVLLHQLMTACYRRTRPERRFWAIIDESPEFLTEDVALGLDKMRKRGLRMVLAHQHLSQLDAAGPAIKGALMGSTGVKAVLGGLPPEDCRVFAETMYRGFYDLQKLKTGLTRMQAVGNVKERLRGGSEGSTATHAEATNWSESEHSAENRSTTKSTGTARSVVDTTSHSVTVTAGSTSTKNESDTEQHTPDGEAIGGSSHTVGTSDAQSESVAVASARSRALGHTASDGLAETEGATTGRSRQRGGSESDSLATSETDNWSEAYRTEYRELPAGDTWSLEEQIHLRAASLARVPTGFTHIQALTEHPQRVHIGYIGNIPILPSMAARLAEKFTAENECNGSAADIDEAISARQARLLAIGRSPDQPPEPDGFADIAAKLRRRRKTDDGDAGQGSGDGVG